MNVDGELIEQIVSSVMEHLQTRSGPVRSANAEVRAEPEVHAEPTTDPPRETSQGVLLRENVITADVLEQRSNGSREITIGPKSILTPSARDFLKSRNITCTRQSVHQTGPAATCRWKAIVVESTPSVAAALDDVCGSGDGCWQRELAGCPSEAVSAAVSAVCRADAVGVVVFTNDAESIACRANRNRQVRAAVVTDTQAVKTVGHRMGANLIAIAPNGKSDFDLRNMLRTFTANGPTQIPNEWDESSSCE